MKNDINKLVTYDRYALLLAINLAVASLITVLGLLRYALTGFVEVPLPALTIVIGCLANAYYLRRTGDNMIAAWILVVLLLLGLLWGGFRTYGFDGPVVLMAPLIPGLAMLLMTLRAAFISLALVVICLMALYIMDVEGFIPTNVYSAEKIMFARFTAITALCVASTWSVWRFASTMQSLLVKIDQQSKTDYLTGILNRRGIESLLAREVGGARRNGSWLSLIMIDIDHFKLFNDLNGHQAGDACLVEIANLIGNCLNRSSDTLGRFGGEEFIVVLPETDSDGAVLVAENIRCRIIETKKAYGADEPRTLTITLGVASGRGGDIESAEALIQLADQVLYSGKRRGRNVVVAETLRGAT